jgi:hypothetical protein
MAARGGSHDFVLIHGLCIVWPCPPHALRLLPSFTVLTFGPACCPILSDMRATVATPMLRSPVRLVLCSVHTESRLEGVDRRNLKIINLSTHYKSG